MFEEIILKPVLRSELIDHSVEDTLLEYERVILDLEREQRHQMLSRLKVMKEMNRRKRTKLIHESMEQGIPLNTKAMHLSYENERFIQDRIDTLKNIDAELYKLFLSRTYEK